MTMIGERTTPTMEAQERNPAQPRYAADLAKDLRRAVRGEVRFDPGSRVLGKSVANKLVRGARQSDR